MGYAMNAEPDRYAITRRFDEPFVMDNEALDRLSGVFEKQMPGAVQFSITNKDGYTQHVSTVNDAMRAENSTANPLVCFEIYAKEPSSGKQACVRLDSTNKNVFINIESKTDEVTNRFFSDVISALDGVLESTSKSIRKILSLLTAAITGVVLLSLCGYTAQYLNMVKAKDELHKIVQSYSNSMADSQKIGFLYDMHLLDVLSTAYKYRHQTPIDIVTSLLFTIVPLAMLLGGSLYLKFKCYPQYVFVWKEYAETYGAIEKRRERIWSVVILAFIVGVFTNCFSQGIINLISG